MSRTFIYARVSTTDQNTDNQVHEIEASGFSVNQRRIVTESISGSVAASERPQFARLLDRLEPNDVLIVTKLDRLGRNAMDVRSTVDRLATEGVRVHCLALGGVDLTSPSGKMTMGVLNAVAEFERDLLIERTHAGIARARIEGKVMGRPPALTAVQQAEAMRRLENGESISQLARDYNTTRQSIMRVREKFGNAGDHAAVSTVPAAPPLLSVTAILWVTIENGSKFTRGKKRVREEIDRLVAAASFTFTKLSDHEYRLAIRYTDDADLKKQIDDLFQEIYTTADLGNCAIVDISVKDEASSRYWDECDGGWRD